MKITHMNNDSFVSSSDLRNYLPINGHDYIEKHKEVNASRFHKNYLKNR